MKAQDLKDVMDLMHKMFPLPDDGEFKGTHAVIINRDTQKLELCVWFKYKDTIRRMGFTLDPEDVIDEDLLKTGQAYIEGLADGP